MAIKEKTRIYIHCPPLVTTGGPQWLQQICYQLRQDDRIDAKMLYFENKLPNPQAPLYTQRYNNPYIKVEQLPVLTKKDIIILPQIHCSKRTFLPIFKNCTKVVLWQSVNFYLSTTQPNELNRWPKGTIHLAQGEYARDYLRFAQVPSEDVYLLNDYISDQFFNFTPILTDQFRQNIICYNPRKEKEFIENIKKYLQTKSYSKLFNFVPIDGYTTKEIINIFSKAKLYFDPGYCPGLDRMPREAAACGCCIMVSNLGGFKYYKDFPIPEKYKFEIENDNIPKILNTIEFLLNNYNERIGDFRILREKIAREKIVSEQKLEKIKERLIRY